jgi:hypothetical protein
MNRVSLHKLLGGTAFIGGTKSVAKLYEILQLVKVNKFGSRASRSDTPLSKVWQQDFRKFGSTQAWVKSSHSLQILENPVHIHKWINRISHIEILSTFHWSGRKLLFIRGLISYHFRFQSPILATSSFMHTQCLRCLQWVGKHAALTPQPLVGVVLV